MDLAYASMSCLALVMALAGRRTYPVPFIALVVAFAAVSAVSRGVPAFGIAVVAYVGFGLTAAVAWSNVTYTFGSRFRPLALTSVGTLASLGLLALAMWSGAAWFVMTALTLAALMFALLIVAALSNDLASKTHHEPAD